MESNSFKKYFKKPQTRDEWFLAFKLLLLIAAFFAISTAAVVTLFTRASTNDQPTTLSVTPLEDASVDSSSPSKNYGDDEYMKIEKKKLSFMKFDIQSFQGRTITKARLRFLAQKSPKNLIEIHTVPDSSWTEKSITYRTMPIYDAAILTTVPARTPKGWVEIDVTDGLRRATGPTWTLAFTLPPGATDSLRFYSKDTKNKPSIIVDFAGMTPGVATPTFSPSNTPMPITPSGMPSATPTKAPGVTVTVAPATATPRVLVTPTVFATPTVFVPGPGTTYYINPTTGKDTNNGQTPATAFQKIQKALDIAKPGTTIILAQGVYNERLQTKIDGTATAPIIIHGTDNAMDPGSRRKTILYGTSRVISVDHSYYQFDGFAVEGQKTLVDKGVTFPTDPNQIVAFKNANQSSIADGRLIYVGASNDISVQGKNMTGIKIINMYLRGAGGECVRMRNNTTNSLVSRSYIEYCGMFAKPKEGFNYHNGEGVYIGTSPKSTDQPMYQNDPSSYNEVSNNVIYTYGSECFNVKENAHHNSFINNECRYNLEPDNNETGLKLLGSNIELRGHANVVKGNTVSWSAGWNIKMKSDEAKWDLGGNIIEGNKFSQAMSKDATKPDNINIYNEQKVTLQKYCGNTIDGNVYGVTAAEVTKPCN